LRRIAGGKVAALGAIDIHQIGTRGRELGWQAPDLRGQEGTEPQAVRGNRLAQAGFALDAGLIADGIDRATGREARRHNHVGGLERFTLDRRTRPVR